MSIFCFLDSIYTNFSTKRDVRIECTLYIHNTLKFKNLKSNKLSK